MATAAPVSGEAPELEKRLEEVKLESNTTEAPPPTQNTREASREKSFAATLREKQDGVLKTPIVDPVETAIPSALTELTPEQQEKYEALLVTVKSWKDVPSTKGKEGPVTEDEIMWLTKECLLRYLRATKWVTAEAAKRLLGTLTWRREYGVGELTGDYISPENETGKQIILGFDIQARPCLYLNPGRQNTEPSPKQVQHLVFMIERVINLMVPGQETMALLIHHKSSKTKSHAGPGLSQGKEVLSILQTHYPERLGRALIINIPWVVTVFYKLITPFIDPLTRQKLVFNEDMRKHVPPQQLWNEFYGDLDFEYDHEAYWPALMKLCEEKHKEQHERWVKGGKHYGESENYIKGGNTPSIGSMVAEVTEEKTTPATLPEPVTGTPEASTTVA